MIDTEVLEERSPSERLLGIRTVSLHMGSLQRGLMAFITLSSGL